MPQKQLWFKLCQIRVIETELVTTLSNNYNDGKMWKQPLTHSDPILSEVMYKENTR